MTRHAAAGVAARARPLGIRFVLETGLPWASPPREVGGRSGPTG